jgi:hypothetical protein
MSRVPLGTDGGTWFADPTVAYDTCFVPQGISADLIADREVACAPGHECPRCRPVRGERGVRRRRYGSGGSESLIGLCLTRERFEPCAGEPIDVSMGCGPVGEHTGFSRALPESIC